MAFSLLASSNPEVNERQEMELTIGSLSFYVGPSGSTRLSDLTKLGPSASKADRITISGSSVGSSSEINEGFRSIVNQKIPTMRTRKPRSNLGDVINKRGR
jgi:hypothetical protein